MRGRYMNRKVYKPYLCACCGSPRHPLSGLLCAVCYRTQAILGKYEKGLITAGEVEEMSQEIIDRLDPERNRGNT